MSDEAPIVDEVGYGSGEETAFHSEDRPTESTETDSRKQEAKPTPHPVKRESAADEITLIWGSIGAALVRTGTDVPVGRCMQFQSVLAGNQLDEFFANTLLDRLLLQPLARAGDKAGTFAAIVGTPILIGIYERNPDAGPILEQFIRAGIDASLEEMAPLLRKQQAKKKRTAQAVADIQETFNIPPGVDPTDAVLHMIFAVQEPGPEPDDEVA